MPDFAVAVLKPVVPAENPVGKEVVPDSSEHSPNTTKRSPACIVTELVIAPFAAPDVPDPT
jgi:hypothetical protein